MCSKAYAFALSLLLLAGCSVLEQRSDCPCLVDLSFEQGFCSDGAAVHVRGLSTGCCFCAEYGPSATSGTITISIPDRREAGIMVCPADFSDYLSDSGLVFPSSLPCPELILFAQRLDTSREHLQLSVKGYKNHCDISVYFVNAFPSNSILELCSSSCGLMADGTPIAGEYRQHLVPDIRGAVLCRLPRQADDSAMLDIVPATGSVRHIALGSLMAQAGYDWSSENLEDISITIDFSSSTARLEYSGWDKEIFLPVAI